MSPDRGRATLDELLDFVKLARGFDFTGYKRSTVERRVAKRMGELGLQRYEDYVDHLELHAEEFQALFDAILINVTGFFRDGATWEHLATEVVPELMAARPVDAPLRVWCPGCATGEEAYTVAMVLASALGESAFLQRVKIFATDVDDAALETARQGTYDAPDVEDVPRDALERFFERADHRYTIRGDLRRAVIFGRNDLAHDPPISRIDLLVCRNTLIYFNAETQGRILRRLHFALGDDGVLLLGRSEMLVAHADLFRPVDPRRRLFRKVVRRTVRDRDPVLAGDPAESAPPIGADVLRDVAHDVVPVAHVAVDRDGVLLLANERARRMLGLADRDIGRQIHDLELSRRPVELGPRLERLACDRRSVRMEGLRWRTPAGQQRLLDVRLTPLLRDGELLGTAISYEDVTAMSELRARLEATETELEQAHAELQATVEELETTNEELQSTNEELETTNEQLLSTNEELETMNEELETMNDELRQRTFQLDDINAFLERILGTLGLGVAVLDRHRQVQLWNAQAGELWGLTADEAQGKPFLALDIGLPVERLEPLLGACLNGAQERQQLTLDAVSRRGTPLRCAVSCLPLSRPGDGHATGVIVMMEPLTA